MKNLKKLKTVFLLFVFILMSHFAQSKEIVILSIGEQKIIQSDQLNRVVGGNKNIVEIIAIPSLHQVHLTGKKSGNTDFTIWEKGNTQRTISVQVILPDLNLMANEIKQRLQNGKINGIKIKKSSRNKLILFGNLNKKNDFKHFSNIIDSYEKNLIINDVEISNELIKLIIDRIKKEFNKTGINVSVSLIDNNNLFLEGEVESKFIKEKAFQIASSHISNFDIIKLKNFITIGISLDKMILISVDFVELDKATGSQLGLKWGKSGLLPIVMSGSGTGGFGSAVDNSNFAGMYKITGGEYLTTLNALKTNSRARILDRPRLLCRSHEKAEFHSGDTIAISIKTNDSASIEYKKIGTILRIEPIVDNYNNIKVIVEVENSTIGDAVEGNMNFPTSRVSTTVNLKSNQTIVLSGLESKKNSKEVIKFPLLGDIPIIGELFKSRLFSNKNKELLIFLTPEVVIPKHNFQITEDNSNYANPAIEMFNKKKDKLKFSIMD